MSRLGPVVWTLLHFISGTFSCFISLTVLLLPLLCSLCMEILLVGVGPSVLILCRKINWFLLLSSCCFSSCPFLFIFVLFRGESLDFYLQLLNWSFFFQHFICHITEFQEHFLILIAHFFNSTLLFCGCHVFADLSERINSFLKIFFPLVLTRMSPSSFPSALLFSVLRLHNLIVSSISNYFNSFNLFWYLLHFCIPLEAGTDLRISG